jgi:hypothetical protein
VTIALSSSSLLQNSHQRTWQQRKGNSLVVASTCHSQNTDIRTGCNTASGEKKNMRRCVGLYKSLLRTWNTIHNPTL